jgi:hypothetical protein
VSVVCCQVEVSASGWSLIQRNPTECGVSECDREASKGEATTRIRAEESQETKKVGTRAIRKVSSHFEYFENRSRGLYVTWQPVRGDLTV